MPFSLLFSLSVRGRNWLYDFRLLPVAQIPLKVISIGNLTVGGTGKTPLALWLAQSLQQRGYRVGILTRGYKGTAISPTLVSQDGNLLATPVEVGDEAIMLARRFSGVVLVGRDRATAATLAHEQFALDVVILDDGFQHRRLHRDVDILLLSAQEAENTWLLPAGPFREPLTSLHRAHIIVVTKKIEGHNYPPTLPFLPNPQSPTSIFDAELVPTALVQVTGGQWQERPLSLLMNRRVMTVTGIANPTPLYRSVREHGANIARVVEFPDHHSYTHSEWQQIVQESDAVDVVLTTEKDLVKLERFSPPLEKLLALRVQFRLEPAEAFLQSIEQRLHPPQKDRTDNGRTVSHQSSHGLAR